MDTGASNYRRFLDGDDGGITDIVREYKDGLILFARGFVCDVYTAEEIAEDTFFRLLVKKPRFSGKSSFRSWLYAIAKHIAVDRIRREERRGNSPLGESEFALADEEDLERSYIKEERKLALHRAMKRLPPEYRQVLWLVYFEDFSNGEAATARGKSDRQMRNLLYRAKGALKTELEKEGFVYEE